MEKGLDGLPIYGLKTAVSAASEILKAFQVCITPLSPPRFSYLQTSVENEAGICDVVDAVEKNQAILLASLAATSNPLSSKSPEYTERITQCQM
jgi:hypothetical protein